MGAGAEVSLPRATMATRNHPTGGELRNAGPVHVLRMRLLWNIPGRGPVSSKELEATRKRIREVRDIGPITTREARNATL